MSTTTQSFASPPPSDLPELELLRGIEVSKVSPRRRHALLQLALAVQLRAWAQSRGEVGTEWRFTLVASEPQRTSLVADVAFVSHDRMAMLGDEAAEEPPWAPDIAVEIRSPDDRGRNVQAKIDLYLAHGAQLVLDVDPGRRCVVAHDIAGAHTFAEGTIVTSAAAPGLGIDVSALLRILDRRRPNP